ncbi:hypothetical protein [Bradyrhizobium genosp. L]|uniref:hypothetical protein n=1 Tax=Bradyrhizobium genosp. L TaxID=83637 RepID=UPI003D9AC2F7
MEAVQRSCLIDAIITSRRHERGAGQVDASWHIAGVGDYDGNGRSDILWHNDNGAVSVWDSGNMQAAHIVATDVDSSWHIV